MKRAQRYLAAFFTGAALGVVAALTEDENDQVCHKGQFNRITEDCFATTHDHITSSDLTGIGRLSILVPDAKITCSAIVLAPGNLLVTSKHCIKFKHPDAEYHFTRPIPGESNIHHELPIGDAGAKYAPYAHVYTPEYNDLNIPEDISDNPLTLQMQDLQIDFGKHATDIAFIKLDRKLSGRVTPLSAVRSEELDNLQDIHAAGYSLKVGPPDKRDHEMTLSTNPCWANITPFFNLLSTCKIDFGDSGGAYIRIENNTPKLAGVINAKLNLDVNFSIAAPVPLLGNYCRREIGPGYCKAFPVPAPGA